eukprot:1773657-Lingulodinium_polyedra.AAC.1
MPVVDRTSHLDRAPPVLHPRFPSFPCNPDNASKMPRLPGFQASQHALSNGPRAGAIESHRHHTLR